MRKYVVRVQYTKTDSQHNKNYDLVWLLKAKNDRDLENKITKYYSESLSLIDGYEYIQISNHMFKKNDVKLMCGNWIGAEIMEDDLKMIKEN